MNCLVCSEDAIPAFGGAESLVLLMMFYAMNCDGCSEDAIRAFWAMNRLRWLGIFLAFYLWPLVCDDVGRKGRNSGYSREVGVVEVVS